MKHPEIVNSDDRGKASCKTVSEVFKKRPWVTEVWETEQNKAKDGEGIDMFVRVKSGFLNEIKMDGQHKVLPVQIKSSTRKTKAFARKYFKLFRIFNLPLKSHLFVLCGMDEADLILADIVGQIVVHVSAFGISEKTILGYFENWGDSEAIEVYARNRRLLLYFWYGHKLSEVK